MEKTTEDRLHMEYMAAKDAAKKWGIHIRVVQGYCKSGRIPGAKKYGVSWMIPAGADKPIDPRKLRKLPKAIPSPYLGCVLLSAVAPMPKDDPDAVLMTLTDRGQRDQYRAELAYLRGDFDAVKAYYADVSAADETYLCAATIAIAAAMATRDYPLFKQIAASVKEIELRAESPEARLAASLLPVFTAVCMNAPELAPPWLRSADFSGFPADARPMLLFMRIKYLQSIGDRQGMLAAAQTARSLLMQENAFTLVDVYLACFCACGNYALGRMDETREFLDRSVAQCEPGGFVSPLGEYTTWVGGLLEIALKKSAPAFEAAVHRHIEGTLKNWLFFHNEFTRDNASLLLSTKEYQLAVLLKEGKTYRQAGEQLCLSMSSVKKMVSAVYDKLGITQKAEIARFVY